MVSQKIRDRRVERKKAEKETKLLVSLFDLASDIIIVHDFEGRFVYFNEATYSKRGYSKEEMTDMSIQRLDAPEYVEFELHMKELVEKGSAVFESVHLCKDGHRVPVEVHARIITAQDKKLILSIVSDISERKKLEQKIEDYAKNLEKLVEERTKQLKDSERLAAIGATAGMVGHDIRNPLQAILSDTFLLRLDLSTLPESKINDDIFESLDSIDKNITYINKIVQDLQDYARPINPVNEEVDFQSVIQDVLIKKAIPENIDASFVIGADADKIVADSSLLKRILVNLVNNAVQAMPNGGRLVIQTYKKASIISVTVEDTGAGIPDEIKSKLFTPLFTTKSRGQGFGLAVVKRMTESLSGTVLFETEKGKGTKFTIELPIKK